MGTGLIHVYTGPGKGKTTSAVGLCARAVGQGFKVLYASFHKNPEKYGYTEMLSLCKLGVKVLNFAKDHPHMDPTMDTGAICKEANAGITKLKEILANEEIDLLVMDEILISIRDEFIEEQLLIDFIKSKPQNLELVITGRNASERIMHMADYVSKIECLKHPFEKGIESRKGIEF